MRRWVRRIFLVPVLVLAVYGGYHAYGSWLTAGGAESCAGIDDYLRGVVADSMVDDIRFRPELAELHVLPIEGDADDKLRGLLQARIQILGHARVEQDVSTAARILRDPGAGSVDGAIWKKLVAFFEPEPGAVLTEAEALDLGRRYGASAILLARVVGLDVQSDHPHLRVESRILDVGTGSTVVPPRVYSSGISRSPFSFPYLLLTIRAASPWGRGLAWVTFAMLLPLLAAPFSRRVLSHESNRASALLLASLTLADAAFAWGLLAFAVEGVLPFAVLAAAGSAALAYNYTVLSWLDDQWS